MTFERLLDLKKLLDKKSYFLLGPRTTGKTFLIRNFLKDVPFFSLLDPEIYSRLKAHPEWIKDLIPNDAKVVVIDEIQLIPEILNWVHHCIEENQTRFLLTGSSARKLKRGNANLLAGRAWHCSLFPLTYLEISKKTNFEIKKALNFGTLPSVMNSDDPKMDLIQYCQLYLKEEIQAEASIRKLPSFLRFLEVAARRSGELISFGNISKELGIPASTIREYYHLLEDTLLVSKLEPWSGKSRRSVKNSKVYFFDCGVTNALANTWAIEPESSLFGRRFEQWIINEVKAMLSYKNQTDPMNFWRSHSGYEVDLIFKDVAVEIKTQRDSYRIEPKGLVAIGIEGNFKRKIVVSFDETYRRAQEIEYFHWKDFLMGVWDETILN